MGVTASRNSSKSKSDLVNKSCSSANVIHVLSIGSISSEEDNSSSSLSGSATKINDITRKAIGSKKRSDTNSSKPHVVRKNSWTTAKISEKRTKAYKKEKTSGQKTVVSKTDISVHSAESDDDLYIEQYRYVEDDTPSPVQEAEVNEDCGPNGDDSLDERTKYRSTSDNKNEQGFSTMNNADILKRQKMDPFQGLFPNRDKPLLNSQEKKTQGQNGLNPVSMKKPGQSNILDQLGQQGIICQKTEAERALGDLRQVGMIKERPGGTQYTLTYDTPKRQMTSRLVPLTGEINRTTSGQKPKRSPWEQSVLKPDRNETCYTPSDLCPPMRNSAGKTWEDDVMPLEVKLTEADKLKIKMLDLDLL